MSLSVTGCDTFTEGNDRDPTLATEAPAGVVLNSAQIATILYNEGNHARVAGIWSSHLTGADRQYLSLEGYSAVASDFNNMWITGYSEVIGDLGVVKEKSQNNPLVLGIAQVLEAYAFGMTTALHGDVPYSEAAQGRDNLNPQFDEQSAIYQGVVQTLDDAISNLQATGGVSPGPQDLFFQGDASKWIEVANTLKARFLLHMGEYQQALNAAQNGISSQESNLVAPHAGTRGVNANPFYVFDEIERSSYLNATSSYAASLLDSGASNYRGNAKTDESARFSHYFTGSPGAWDLNTSSGSYFGQASDYALVTYAENELIKAEAELLANNDIGAAVTALNNARQASDSDFIAGDFYQDYVPGDFASGGMANQGESQGNALLKEILEEKYVTLMAHLETFNDLRRTDNFLGVPPKAGSQLPQRFLIAQTEINANDNAPDTPPSIMKETPMNASIDYTGL